MKLQMANNSLFAMLLSSPWWHPRWIEAVVAIVVCKPERQHDDAEVLAPCRDRLASFKVPRRADFVEKLPKNP